MSVFPTKILLATDGSEDARRATEAAADLGGTIGSELHVVHVWHDVPGFAHAFVKRELRRQGQEILDEQVKKIEESGGTVARAHLMYVDPDLPEVPPEEAREAAAEELGGGREQERLEDRANELGGIMGGRPEIRVSGGSPAAVILHAAQGETPLPLIAVGGRGIAGIRRTRLGSVSTKLVTAAPGPVLIYPHVELNRG